MTPTSALDLLVPPRPVAIGEEAVAEPPVVVLRRAPVVVGAHAHRRRPSVADDHQARLGHLVHGVARPLAGVARVLDAAVGHLVGPVGGRLVDRDAAEVERRVARSAVEMSDVKMPACRP